MLVTLECYRKTFSMLKKILLISSEKPSTPQDQWTCYTCSRWMVSECADEIMPQGILNIPLKFELFFFSGILSPNTLCHIDFIPGRSCLEVPVGRKCRACNGLVPEFLHKLFMNIHEQSLARSPPTKQDDKNFDGHVGRECGGIPIW